MSENKMSDDERLYLQFLQENIARMNTNSVNIKTWCITIVSALLAIFSDTKNIWFVWISLIPIVLFCILDSLYLQQEHKFISLYNDYVKDKDNKLKVFEMPIKNYDCNLSGLWKAFKSWSIVLVYPILFVIVIVAGYIFC